MHACKHTHTNTDADYNTYLLFSLSIYWLTNSLSPPHSPPNQGILLWANIFFPSLCRVCLPLSVCVCLWKMHTRCSCNTDALLFKGKLWSSKLQEIWIKTTIFEQMLKSLTHFHIRKSMKESLFGNAATDMTQYMAQFLFVMHFLSGFGYFQRLT